MDSKWSSISACCLWLTEKEQATIFSDVIKFWKPGKRSKPLDDSVKSSEIDEDWQKISEMHSR